MKICVGCRVEMNCTKTGALTVWGDSHAYSGDEFTCPQCGAVIRILAREAREIPGAMDIKSAKPISMDQRVPREEGQKHHRDAMSSHLEFELVYAINCLKSIQSHADSSITRARIDAYEEILQRLRDQTQAANHS